LYYFGGGVNIQATTDTPSQVHISMNFNHANTDTPFSGVLKFEELLLSEDSFSGVLEQYLRVALSFYFPEDSVGFYFTGPPWQ